MTTVTPLAAHSPMPRQPLTAERFASAFRRHFPDAVGKRVLVALSGGSDSAALLGLLHAVAASLGLELVVAHIHHHARGVEADGDALFCAARARQLGVPFELAHLRPRRPHGCSPEAWWRDARYRALERLRQRTGCAVVATGHTADDQAETVLLKLLRGAGPRGVAGVRRRNAGVIRPLLDTRRADLRDWLAAGHLAFREDSSNASVERPRGRLRHDLLPRLVGAFPGAVDHLAAFAMALADDDEFLAGELAARATWPAPGRSVPRTDVAQLPRALRVRWVLALASLLPLGEPPSREQLEQIESLLVGGRPAAVDLGRRWVLRRRGSRLVLSPPPCEAFGPMPAGVPSRVELPGGFVATLGRGGRAWHTARLAGLAGRADLVWRSPRPGERFAGATRPLAGLLAARAVPAEWRRAWPLLLAGDTIVWAPALGVAPGWEARPGEGVTAGLEEPWQGLGKSIRAR